nr:MAG TPA: hypothetical protein [Caudoviricetes sp.]
MCQSAQSNFSCSFPLKIIYGKTATMLAKKS